MTDIKMAILFFCAESGSFNRELCYTAQKCDQKLVFDNIKLMVIIAELVSNECDTERQGRIDNVTNTPCLRNEWCNFVRPCQQQLRSSKVVAKQ